MFPYMSLLGSLLWVTLTRPDVTTVVSRVCIHGAAPTRTHRRATIRILRYLLSTCELGLRFPVSKQDPSVSAYVDAAFANEPSRKSRYGYAVFLGSCLVSWVSKCTTMVCLSTAETEFVAATEAAKDVVWLRGLLMELGFTLPVSSLRSPGGQSGLCLHDSNNSVSGRNRHFAVKIAGGELPWRLSREEVSILDTRVGNMWRPHYMDVLYRDGYSFFKKSNRMWKARHKSFILLTILPTCLRGYVSAVHRGILTIVNALRQLEGVIRFRPKFWFLCLCPRNTTVRTFLPKSCLTRSFVFCAIV